MRLALVADEGAPLASRSKGQREPSNADDNVTRCHRQAALRRTSSNVELWASQDLAYRSLTPRMAATARGNPM